jgi:hypothetical protein
VGSYWPGWFIEQLSAYPLEDTYKVLVCTEPPTVQPEMYEKVRTLKGEYDITLSLADTALLNSSDGVGNVVQWSFGSTHVPLHLWRIYPKTRLCSIIASTQTWAPGHKLRHEAVSMLREAGFDCVPLGKGYKYLDEKVDGLRDYMFSIVIENSVSGKYMTEKIIDAVATGTIPVYWGTPYAAAVFGDGILTFSTLAELRALLPRLTRETYEAMLPAARANVARAMEWVPPERWLWRNVFECAVRWHAANGDCRGDEELEWGHWALPKARH